MDQILLLIVYIIPFIILYFVISAAVKRGIDQSEVGRMIVKKHMGNNDKNNK